MGNEQAVRVIAGDLESPIIEKILTGVLVNNPMYFLQDIIRRGARMIGWEIGDAIENVMWSVGIGCFLLCCAVFSCSAVAFQIMFHR